MLPEINITKAFVQALTGDPNAVCDWRVINDRDRADYGKNIRGNVDSVASTLSAYNEQNYGVFITVNAFNDTPSKTLQDVSYIRAHFVDLDDVLSAQEAYQRAVSSDMPPHFAVQSSAGKFHLYWLVEPYVGNEFFTQQQRKLLTLYGGDRQVVDATRVLRVPGFYHTKSDPQLTKCWQVSTRQKYTSAEIAAHLINVDVVASCGSRLELGDESKKAPSFDILVQALNMIDPNEQSREEWLLTSSAFKQAGWTLATPDQLFETWSTWCSRYIENDVGENRKLWDSVRDTQVGWSHFKRVTNIQAYLNMSQPSPVKTKTPTPTLTQTVSDNVTDATILDATGKKVWFDKCFFIESDGRIFTRTGRFMNATQFNGSYGGKQFCLGASGGKVTDEAWKAALRSTDWKIPTVDHVRFLPQEESFAVVKDDLGRTGLNIYLPAVIKTKEGDVSKWLDYLSRIFSTPEDVAIFNSYVAHCIKFPGWKIPWAILLQSAQGIGKQMIGEVIKHCVGEMYSYQPKAEELVSGVSRFNGWMANKTMIFVDEVRVGDRYDLMNGLKTIITDKRIAVESKGVDQNMADNVANWLFFSNFKDAFPIDENERRYCIFYSKLQSAAQIAQAGLTKEYFDDMYRWFTLCDGFKIIAHYYMNYPIERGYLPHRAPHTSSYKEVLRIGRSPLRVVLDNKIEAGKRGFRNGYVSLTAYAKCVAETSSIRTKPQEHTLRSIVEQAGYVELGTTSAPVVGEDVSLCSVIYGQSGLAVENYEKMQNSC